MLRDGPALVDGVFASFPARDAWQAQHVGALRRAGDDAAADDVSVCCSRAQSQHRKRNSGEKDVACFNHRLSL